ncbi:hypothetical protein [Desulfothermobacter acidiphilus]|uniref:hypothetical protein n=1 Tax=Desulfothermobacter acidiphilus TaxID=1938353 RepID=UPI003F895C19
MLEPEASCLGERVKELVQILQQYLQGESALSSSSVTLEALLSLCQQRVLLMAQQGEVTLKVRVKGNVKKPILSTCFLPQILVGLLRWAVCWSSPGGKVLLEAELIKQNLLFTLEYEPSKAGIRGRCMVDELPVFTLLRAWLNAVPGSRFWISGCLRGVNRFNLEVPLQWAREDSCGEKK